MDEGELKTEVKKHSKLSNEQLQQESRGLVDETFELLKTPLIKKGENFSLNLKTKERVLSVTYKTADAEEGSDKLSVNYGYPIGTDGEFLSIEIPRETSSTARIYYSNVSGDVGAGSPDGYIYENDERAVKSGRDLLEAVREVLPSST